MSRLPPLCQIPQIQRHKRINVIQSDFIQPGQTDWAVVCKTKAETRLLVFSHGAQQQPMEVVKVRNGLYADVSITAASRQAMADYLTKTQTKPGQPPPQLEHDGISYWLARKGCVDILVSAQQAAHALRFAGCYLKEAPGIRTRMLSLITRRRAASSTLRAVSGPIWQQWLRTDPNRRDVRFR